MKNIILISFFLLAKGLMACSCASDSAFTKEDFDGYSYIVKGRIEKIDTLKLYYDYKTKNFVEGSVDSGFLATTQVVYKVKLLSYFSMRKKTKDEYFYIDATYVYNGGANCAYPFYIGNTYIIYGGGSQYNKRTPSRIILDTNICTRTTGIIEDETSFLKQFTEEKFISN